MGENCRSAAAGVDLKTLHSTNRVLTICFLPRVYVFCWSLLRVRVRVLVLRGVNVACIMLGIVGVVVVCCPLLVGLFSIRFIRVELLFCYFCSSWQHFWSL